MAIDFPNSPLLNETFTSGIRTWIWNGSVWELQSYGAQGATGPVAGSANQVVYKNSSNAPSGSANMTFDGSDLSIGGKVQSVYTSGDEGGEFFLNKATTNTTLNTGVTVDVWQNRLRFFEQGGTARGGFIDISTMQAGVGTNLASYTYLTTAQRTGLTPVKGQTVYDTDTGRLLVYYGATTGWQQPWNLPWGHIDNKSTTTAGSALTAVTDVSGLVITTPTQVAGRLLKWTIQGHIQTGSSADTASLAIWSGTTSGSALATTTATAPNFWAYFVTYHCIETTTAAALSRRVRISRGDGTNNTVSFYADTNRPGRLICEDIGPASTTPPSA